MSSSSSSSNGTKKVLLKLPAKLHTVNNDQNEHKESHEETNNNNNTYSTPNTLSLPASSLQTTIEQMKIHFPERYENAQKFGAEVMSKSYDLQTGVDIEGDTIQAKCLLQSIAMYDLQDNDLTSKEFSLLTNIYGTSWRQDIETLVSLPSESTK